MVCSMFIFVFHKFNLRRLNYTSSIYLSLLILVG